MTMLYKLTYVIRGRLGTFPNFIKDEKMIATT